MSFAASRITTRNLPVERVEGFSAADIVTLAAKLTARDLVPDRTSSETTPVGFKSLVR